VTALGSAPSASSLLVAGLALLAPACAEPAQLPSSFLAAERTAFVPPGRGRLEGFTGPHAEYGVDGPLLADRFEVTRGAWLEAAEGGAAGGAPPPPALRGADDRGVATWGDATATLPAYATIDDARAFAAARGMRLPSAGEWLFLAVGSGSHAYPWGPRFQQAFANTLELGLGQPTPVGAFENGCSPFGCYDVLGNVWEWVEGALPGYGESPFAEGAGGGGSACAMGGSYLYRRRAIFGPPEEGETSRPVFLAQGLSAGYLSEDVGLRCVADAGAFLREHAPAWGGVPTARLEALGASWGEPCVELVEQLRTEPGAARALDAIARGARSAAGDAR
jgi:formylglycine-generating enzyme required for sulfatase activity